MIMTASIAQLVEHGTENPCVAGSIPARGTIKFIFIVPFIYIFVVFHTLTFIKHGLKFGVFGEVAEWSKAASC